MANPRAPESRYAAIIPTLLSAALFYFGTGLQPFWPATWLAPLPLLWFAFRAPRRRLFWVGLVACFLGGLNLAPYLLKMAPLPAVLVVMLLPAAVFGLALRWAGRLAAADRPWSAVFALPLAWTSWELLLLYVSPDGSFLNLAYSQADLLPLVQVASLTGLSGITFLLLLAPSALAWLLARRGGPAAATAGTGTAGTAGAGTGRTAGAGTGRTAGTGTGRFRRISAEGRWPAMAGLGLVVAAVGFGLVRLATSEEGEALKMGLLADDSRVLAFKTESREEALEVVEAYALRINELAAGGAKVVILPEKVVGVAPPYEDELVERLRTVAKSANVTLVVGLNLLAREPKRNRALVLAADGSTLVDYEKAFLVAGWERGYARGETPGRFELEGMAAGVAICKDLDFPRWIARYVGVRVLFAPAWDFGADGWLHARMAVFRAVEQGFSLVRSANEGLVTVSDAYGRVPAEGRGGGGPVAVSTRVPLGPGGTLYGRIGDVFGWLVVGLFGLALAASLWR